LKKLKLIRYKHTPYGGAENALARLSVALGQHGVEHEVLSSNSYGDESRSVGVPKWIPGFAKIFYFAKKVCALKCEGDLYFSLERIPCADIYRAGDGVHARWLERRLEGKGWFQKALILANPLHLVYLYLEKKCFQNAQTIIANSEFVKGQIVKSFGANESKIVVIHNGYDRVGVSDEQKAALRAEFGLGDRKVLLFVGSGFYRKGVAELLGLAAQLEGDFRLLIVGKEKKLQSYLEAATDLGISDKVVFTGARKDAAVFYEIADIFIFPTLYEPFSNVCLEAMAHECAVVTTANNGASEVLDEIFVMRDENDEAILPTLQKLLDDERFLDETKAKNRAKSQGLTMQINLEKTLKVIQTVENTTLLAKPFREAQTNGRICPLRNGFARRVLIRLPNWIGDAVMATPAIEALKSVFADADFVLVGSGASCELFRQDGRASKIIVDESNKLGFFARIAKTRQIAEECGDIDIAITFQNNLFSALLLYLTGAKMRIGYKKELRSFMLTNALEYDKHAHQVTRYQKLANEAIGEDLAAGKTKLISTAQKTGKKILGINPGAAYGSAKRWDAKKFAEVAHRLSPLFDEVKILGGGSEKAIADEISEYLEQKCVKNYENLAGKTTMQELIDIVSQMSMFVTNDSGTMHIAGAFEVPTVAIFGPTDDTETHQWQNPKSVIIKKKLECQPCKKRVCPLGTNVCMEAISAAEVADAATLLL
jgi:UDP-glucose:(heptosyl)LPS alpha-1,3-glucosyltransferase